MHSVLFSVVYIKRDGGAKALYPSICTYTHMHLRVCVERKRRRRKATAVISCYIEAHTYHQTNYEEQRLTDSQACRNSTASVLTLNASERLFTSQ